MRKMNFKSLPISALAVLLLATACTSEETQPLGQSTPEAPAQEADSAELRAFGEVPPGMTAFLGYASVDPKAGLRSAGRYEGGSELTYYWTKGDRVWIQRHSGGDFELSSRSDIDDRLNAGRTNKTLRARFYFSGAFPGRSFPIRYTGTENYNADRVTISSRQRQDRPNDAMHLGTSGDCGTAVATRTGRIFDFNLVRKAAYITFAPYNSLGAIEGGRLTSIKITAGNQALNGTYGFDDNGLQLDSRPSRTERNGSTILSLGRFAVPQRVNVATNAASVVIAPGAYRDVTVEYTLEDPDTGVSTTITRRYPSMTFAPGQHRFISQDLEIMVFDDKYYMWDAQQEYWYGYKRSQPRQIYGQNDNYPRSRHQHPQRWYSTAYFSGGSPVNAVASARNNPNVNETHWYVEGGNAHWDDQTVWSGVGHLRRGGVWLRTQQSIQENYRPRIRRDFKRETYNGYDFTTTTVIANHSLRIVHQGKPSSPREYFFLPALGYYHQGKLKDIGYQGYYWTSSPTHGGIHTSYALNFRKDFIQLYMVDRPYGLRSWLSR